jgi:hypothetical protein
MSPQVRELAHARSGDKGNTSNIGVFAYDDEAYEELEKKLTEEKVLEEMSDLVDGPVTRYDVPSLNGFNFLIDNALDGGVTTSLRQDAHGKSFSFVMLGIELED